MADETETDTKEIDAFITHEHDGQVEPSDAAQSPSDDDTGADDEADTEDDDDDAGGGDADDDADSGDDDADEEDSDSGEDGADGEEGEADADDDAADDADDDDEKPKPKKKNAKTRIAELTKSRRQAERKTLEAQERNAALEQRISDLEKGLTGDKEGDTSEGESSGDKGKPDPKDFKYGEVDPEYTEALTNYLVEKKLDTAKAKEEESQQTEAAEQFAKELKTQYDDKITDGVSAYEDFEEVVVARADRNDFPLTQETAMMALESPVGHHVLYAIAKDKKLANKISKMSPALQGREFGRLEAQYQPDGKKIPRKKNKTPKAQPPHTKGRGSGGKIKTDLADANFADFEKTVMAEQRRNDK